VGFVQQGRNRLWTELSANYVRRENIHAAHKSQHAPHAKADIMPRVLARQHVCRVRLGLGALMASSVHCAQLESSVSSLRLRRREIVCAARASLSVPANVSLALLVRTRM
jgi:hypothetical protein